MAKTTKRNRRPLNPAQQWRPELIIITEVGFTAGPPQTVQINFASPVFGPTEEVQWPLIAVAGGAEFIPDEAVLNVNGQDLELHFSDVPIGFYTLIVPAYEPGFRTPQGGYVAPSEWPIEVVI